MGTINLIPPVAGTPAVAGTFTTAFTTIQTLANGNIDNNNISATAAIAYSKLSLANSIAQTDLAASLLAVLPRVYDRATATVDVQNTLTETSLYTKSITGGDMGTSRMLRLTAVGDILHNNVAGDTVTLRVKFGGTTFYNDALNVGTVIGAARVPWVLNLYVSNLGAANSQMISGSWFVPQANLGAATNGIGLIGPSQATQDQMPAFGISTLGTIDTTSAQTLDITTQWGTASANNSWRMRYAVLELV